jgi:hypothetical protein
MAFNSSVYREENQHADERTSIDLNIERFTIWTDLILLIKIIVILPTIY